MAGERGKLNPSGMGLGIALGVALGAAMGNVGLGLALGTAAGAALSFSIPRKNDDKDDNLET